RHFENPSWMSEIKDLVLSVHKSLMRVGEEPINIHGDGMIDIEVGGQELAGVVVIEGGVRHHGSEGEPEGSKVNVGPILVGCLSCEEERKLHG
ncbi:unnamed protein product, partial [Ilex paraguariensis]